MSFIVKSALLRVIQEFIQNSLKHAGCSAINIKADDQPGGLAIILSDNGKGFDVNGPGSGGIGLNNMKRRIQLIGGTFNLQSKAGEGTTLLLFIDQKKLLTG